MTKLIALYFYVEERYNKGRKYNNEKFSSNKNPGFSDAELLTVYLFSIMEERRFRIKDIYNFTKKILVILVSPIGVLPGFNEHLNRMEDIFRQMLTELLALLPVLEPD